MILTEVHQLNSSLGVWLWNVNISDQSFDIWTFLQLVAYRYGCLLDYKSPPLIGGLRHENHFICGEVGARVSLESEQSVTRTSMGPLPASNRIRRRGQWWCECGSLKLLLQANMWQNSTSCAFSWGFASSFICFILVAARFNSWHNFISILLVRMAM